MVAEPAKTPVPARGPHNPYAAFLQPNFRLYVSGNIIATIGQQMQTVAVGWELYERTGSALALGGVGLVQVLPIVLLTLPAGHVADRYSRRLVLMLSQVLFIVSSLGLAAVSFVHGPLILFYFFLFLTGTARAFQGPAKGALLPQIVEPDRFSNAVTWNSVGWQLAAVLGPALGGAVIGLSHQATPVYVIDAVMALIFLGLIAPIRPLSNTAGTPPALRDLLGGVEFIRRTPVLLAAITLDLFAVLLGGAVTLLPIFAKDILHVGPAGLGWLLAAQSIGAVAMALVLAHRPFRRAGPALLRAVVGFGLATIVFGLSRNFLLSFAMLMVLGALDGVSVIIRSTLVQVRTPDYLRGRVAAINSLFIGTSNELGGFESGALASIVGPVASVVVGGIGTIVVVGAVARLWPEIRALSTLDEVVAAPVTAIADPMA
ncbi:MAG: MFS transporter [Gemmatimonadota bacterium]